MFTPITTALGGILLQISTTTLLLTNSQVLGASSLVASTLRPPNLTTTPTLIGLLASPLLLLLDPSHIPSYPNSPWHITLAAGALVGFGTSLAHGCTSGHMLCGVARGSLRSLVATATFFTTAVATAWANSSPPYCYSGPCYTPTYPPWESAAAMVAAAIVGSYLIRSLPRGESSRIAARVFNGFVFGVGLLVSGMASPAKTLGFLAVFDPLRFDPSLLMVAILGMGGNATAWWGFGRWGAPELTEELAWSLPDGWEIEWRLLTGSAVFGVGWGLLGVCPGPGVIAAVLNGWKGLGWVGAFLGGQLLAGLV